MVSDKEESHRNKKNERRTEIDDDNDQKCEILQRGQKRMKNQTLDKWLIRRRNPGELTRLDVKCVHVESSSYILLERH